MEIEENEVPVYQKEEPKIAWWLKLSYILLPLWGFYACYVYWNGSVGWLDPGAWQGLQKAANTTAYSENRLEKS